jgi:hypothetical protein
VPQVCRAPAVATVLAHILDSVSGVIRLPGFVAHHLAEVGVGGAERELLGGLALLDGFQLDQKRLGDGQRPLGVPRFGVVLFNGLAVDTDSGRADG